MNIEFTGDFLQQLRGFYYTATTGSMVKAAALMHRSQSSVSRLIQHLEASFDTTLFHRHRTGVRLTEDGERIMGIVISTFEQLSLLHSEISHQNTRPPEGLVSLLVASFPYNHFIQPLLSDLRRELPGLELDFRASSDVEDIVYKVSTYSVDFAIAPERDYSHSFTFQPLFASRLFLALPEEMAAHLTTSLTYEDLVVLPHIDVPPDKASAIHIRRYLPSHLALKCVHYGFTQQMRADMVRAGYGVAILDENTIQRHLADQAGIRTFALDHLFPPRRFGLLHRTKTYFTVQAKALMDFFQQHSSLNPDDTPTSFH